MKLFKNLAIIAALASVAAAPGLVISAEHHHSHDSVHETVAAETAPVEATEANPLIEEMRKLDGVFRDIVSGVSLGDGKAVHAAIEKMHGTMEKTQEAVHEGQVKVPKNANRIKEFVALDKEFHSNLEKLAQAAHANNQNKMLGLTKKLMDGCVKCHSVFRK